MNIKSCYERQQFRSQNALESCVYLQRIFQRHPCDAYVDLIEHAIKQEEDAHLVESVIVLCRMLFICGDGSPLRRPALGAPDMTADWPHEPIAIFKGVPFLISQRYMLGGLPESGLQYLAQCFFEGTWNSFRYAIPSGDEMNRIATEFVKLHTGAVEEQWIMDQVT